MTRKFNEAKEFIAGADNLAVALQMAVDHICHGTGDSRQMHQLAALDAVIGALRNSLDCARDVLETVDRDTKGEAA